MHNLLGRVRVHFGIEGDHASKGGLGVGVAGALIDGYEGRVGLLNGGARRIAVFHDRARGSVHIFQNANGMVHILEIGLGQAAFAGLEHGIGAQYGVCAISGPIERRRLMGIGAVTQILHLDITASQYFNAFRKRAFGTGAIHGF